MSRASAAFEPCPEAIAAPVLADLEARFGLGKAALSGHRLWHRPGSPALWIAAAGLTVPPAPQVQGIGLCAYRDPPPRGKPTTVFLLRFGSAATRGVLDVSPAEAERFGPGTTYPLDALAPPLRGYVIVRTGGPGGRVLGRGYAADGRVLCEQKRSWRPDLAEGDSGSDEEKGLVREGHGEVPLVGERQRRLER